MSGPKVLKVTIAFSHDLVHDLGREESTSRSELVAPCGVGHSPTIGH